MSHKFEGFLVDPFDRTVAVVDWAGTADLQRLVGHDDLDFSTIGAAPDHTLLTCVVHGGGYYEARQAWWRVAGYAHPLGGIGLVFGTDSYGETCDTPPIGMLSFAMQIEWLGLTRPPLPPVTVDGVVVADFNGPHAPKSQAELMQRIEKAAGGFLSGNVVIRDD